MQQPIYMRLDIDNHDIESQCDAFCVIMDALPKDRFSEETIDWFSLDSKKMEIKLMCLSDFEYSNVLTAITKNGIGFETFDLGPN